MPLSDFIVSLVRKVSNDTAINLPSLGEITHLISFDGRVSRAAVFTDLPYVAKIYRHLVRVPMLMEGPCRCGCVTQESAKRDEISNKVSVTLRKVPLIFITANGSFGLAFCLRFSPKKTAMSGRKDGGNSFSNGIALTKLLTAISVGLSIKGRKTPIN